MTFPLLVNNMGNHKNPWNEFPLAIIEELRRKKEEEKNEAERPRLELPVYIEDIDAIKDKESEEDDGDEEFEIIIKLMHEVH